MDGEKLPSSYDAKSITSFVFVFTFLFFFGGGGGGACVAGDGHLRICDETDNLCLNRLTAVTVT